MPNAMQRAINELNPMPDYSDGSAIVNEATINGAVQQNQQAQQAAMLQQLLTNPALTANLESSALGQAMQNNARQEQVPTANYFQDYSRNSNDVYDSAYSDLLRQGYTTKEAEYGAAKAARDYKANRLAYTQAQMENGGYDPATGLITNQGLRALIDMQSESPEAAALWSQAYDLPKVGYAYDRDIAKNDHREATRFGYDQQRDATRFDRDVQMLGIRQQMQQAEMERRAQYAVQAAKERAYYDAVYNQGKSPQEARAIAEMAGRIAYSSILSGYNGNALGNGGSNNQRNGRSGNNSGIGTKEAYKNLENVMKSFYETQSELQPGQRNQWSGLYAEALYNYYGDIDTDDPRNLAAWRDYYMAAKGMTEDQFVEMINKKVQEGKDYEQNLPTIMKNQALNINPRHHDDDESAEDSSSNPEEPATEYEEAKTSPQMAEGRYDPDAPINNPVSEARRDMENRLNAREQEVIDMLTARSDDTDNLPAILRGANKWERKHQ